MHSVHDLFFWYASKAVYAEGALPVWGDLSNPGAASRNQRAGGEVPPVCGRTGALLRHVRRVHRGQGPKTAGFTLFPHFPSQVGVLAQPVVMLNFFPDANASKKILFVYTRLFRPFRCLQTNGTKGCPKCFKSSMKPGFVWLWACLRALDFCRHSMKLCGRPDWAERSRRTQDVPKLREE